MSESDLAVELEGIEKRFPGVIANRDVSLKVRRGTIHAIVGENGAGKSTLMKTLYGMHQPDAGTIAVNGQLMTFKSPSDAIAAGIGMVHQHFMLADNLTVLENVILGSEPTSGGRIDFGNAHALVREAAQRAGSLVDLDAQVSELGVGERQRIEIIKVLYRGAKILILDEPTAVLVPQEVAELFVNLRELVKGGATVIFISHKLDEVLAVADDITVIRAGTTVGTVKPAEVNKKQLGEMMVGSELPVPPARVTKIGDKVLLNVDDVTVAGIEAKPLVESVSLRVRAGEIVGIAGVEGNGQFELCEAIMGLRPVAEGKVELDGKDLTTLSAQESRGSGIGYVPFDRQREGLMLGAPLWENALLGREIEPQFRKGPFLAAAAVRADTRRIISTFGVRTPSETVPAYALSGGNQQKLIVGRELESHPTILIAAHPTRGVDVGAQATIWEELRKARDAGMGILLISADLDELLGLSDTLVVMFDGRITARLAPTDATPDMLGVYMTGTEQEVA
ncbi:ABC transporter ATP-binding protein [Nakamurella antarctica]|uniref:ABC transporter ATP-binding protein n=1 Tax=Nakamurella antarctica TaxID=1902245 RepID=A0A3G8ZP77_9ACTN|nr:ABC transporter ATP-binding protein [Nakamurella antarctica]AZI58585.1 ABC transporter ATP-binding protein [Nakamurella antarctica]